ncbi:hypothetical protein SCHPADRAFT_16570 [Schizopora paradoxa]|uniref:RRM domain-containing protein n=1 Tax=Schizopora paradoxa TaxID=27342 RepID=A0A0H2SFP5_9AGAM|nr:hypothetical protein SCHPADRAFT_16570 [Schizopora paradoxa]
MPVMSTLRGRETAQQQQRWGTRYDSLVVSPTPSQVLGAADSSDGESEAVGTVGDKDSDGDAKADNVFEEDSVKMSWADDEVPDMSPPPSQSATASPSYRSPRIKMPHNASVFIGSLPTHMSEAELKHTLQEHLSQFANVHKIKLVHDQSKGCISAFVQCEDADQASKLIAKSPKPFHGRTLRFESARAHRSLYLSYRKPRRFTPNAGNEVSRSSNENDCEELGGGGRWVELDLPEHMHVVLPPDSKYAIVHYNSDALEKAGLNPRQPAFPAVSLDQLEDNGRLFSNMEFDEKTMRDLASCFGPIEYFRRFVPTVDGPPAPPGHDTARSPRMDEYVWEVKWDHRDDCIIALNTLKTIPHICASWTAQSSKGRAPASPASRFGRLYSGQEQPSRPRDLRLNLACSRENSPDYRILKSPRHEPTPPTDDIDFPSLNPPVGRRGSSLRDDLPMSDCSGVLCIDGADSSPSGNFQKSVTMSSLDSVQTLISDSNDESPEIYVKDISESSSESEGWSKTPSCELDSSKQKPYCDASRDEIDISSNPDEEAPAERNPGDRIARRTKPALFHRRSLSNPAPRIDTSVASTYGVPTTPELSGATFSPESPASAVPHTPLYPPAGALPTPYKGHGYANSGDAYSVNEYQNHVSSSMRVNIERDGEHREVDPKTIFVGGLEIMGLEEWNEQRLRAVFGRYGTIIHVKYVRQNPKKSAFAFITYSDEGAPPKAIAAEHNRIYGDRAIRVQIRDIYPMRNFKYRPRGIQRPRFGINGHTDFGPRDLPLSSPFNSNMYGRGPAFDRSFPAAISNDRSFISQVNDRAHPPLQRVPPFVVIPRQMSQRQGSIADSESFLSSQSIADSAHSTESDTRTAVSITPPPSMSNLSLPAPAVVPVTPQSAGHSPIAYYHPQPWPSPYGPTIFPVPVGAYGPVMPQIPLQYASLPNPAGAAVSQPFHWGTPIPYQYVPVIPTEVPSAAAASTPEVTSKGQAPLSATGFVQGEHGGLIPIYQPDALNRYMAGSSSNMNAQGASGATSPDASACTSPVGPPVRPFGLVSPPGPILPGGAAQASLYAYPPPFNSQLHGSSPSQTLVPSQSHSQPHLPSLATSQSWGQVSAACAPNMRHQIRPGVDQPNDLPFSGSTSSSQLASVGAGSFASNSALASRVGFPERNYPPRRGSEACRIDTSGSTLINHLRSPARLDLDRHGSANHGSISVPNDNPMHRQMNMNVRQQGSMHTAGQQ